MLGQSQPARLCFILFSVHFGVGAFPTSRTVQSRQEYSYVPALLTICFLLVLLFVVKWIYISRCHRKQLSDAVGTKHQTNLEFCDLSSSVARHSTATANRKSAFLVGFLGSPSWETRNSVIFARVSSFLPFSRPHSISSSPRNQSAVNPEKGSSRQIHNSVPNLSVENALVQPQAHSAVLLTCELRDHDSEPAILTTSKKPHALNSSTEANPLTWQISFSPQPQKLQSPMLYDKDTAMRQIYGLDFSYKLLPSSIGTAITSPKPVLLHPRQVRSMDWQRSPKLFPQDPQVIQPSTNSQADLPSSPSLTPMFFARNCDFSVPIAFIPTKTDLCVSNSTLVNKTVVVGEESTGLPSIATQTLQCTPSFDPTGKYDIHRKSPLQLLENSHGDKISIEETDAPRLIALRPLKIRPPTKRVFPSPKPGPSPLRTMFVPLDECENPVTSRPCDQGRALDVVHILGSPGQVPLSGSWNAAQPMSSTALPTRSAYTRPLNRFKTNVDSHDKLIGLLLEELVHETSEWDDSLFVNNNFKAMIDSSKSCGALEMQVPTRNKTNPRISQKLYSSSFSRLEDIPEVDAVPLEALHGGS